MRSLGQRRSRRRPGSALCIRHPVSVPQEQCNRGSRRAEVIGHRTLPRVAPRRDATGLFSAARTEMSSAPRTGAPREPTTTRSGREGVATFRFHLLPGSWILRSVCDGGSARLRHGWRQPARRGTQVREDDRPARSFEMRSAGRCGTRSSRWPRRCAGIRRRSRRAIERATRSRVASERGRSGGDARRSAFAAARHQLPKSSRRRRRGRAQTFAASPRGALLRPISQ
jgi:hypothetical protein